MSLELHMKQSVKYYGILEALWAFKYSWPLKPNDRLSCQLLWYDLMTETDMDEGRIQCGQLKDIFIGLIPI